MPDHETDENDNDEPSLRQKLHWATGDRDAEAQALADRAGDTVDQEDAYVAVKRAHGELRDEEPESGGEELATAEDAKAASEDEDG